MAKLRRVGFVSCLLPLLTDPLAAQTTWERAPLLEHRAHAAIAYDLVRDRTVLFGGSSAFGVMDDTFEWDGTRWIARTPVHRPPARRGSAMVYDAARAVVVLFGGGTDHTWFGDTWQWDGVDWSQQQPVQSPPPRADHAMAFDSVRAVTVLFGGRNASNPEYNDTWECGGYHLFGQGCAGSSGVPQIAPVAGMLPYAGVIFELRFTALPASPFVFAALGYSNTSWLGVLPLPLNLGAVGLPACNLLVDTPDLVALPIANGEARWQIDIPAHPGLVGVTFYNQALALDPGSSAGAAMTAGAVGVVGGP